MLAELATGEGFDQVFERLLARPLGLKHTRFTPVDAGPGHSPVLAGGARSTVRYYARFLAMLAESGKFDACHFEAEHKPLPPHTRARQRQRERARAGDRTRRSRDSACERCAARS
jgi:CubicO group peptidase (beta-lactamase class C family)